MPDAAQGLEIRMFTVGMIQENCFLINRAGDERAVIVDPGAEPQRLIHAIESEGLKLEAILLTHTHYDHIGAVAELVRETEVPVYCPEIEVPILRDPMSFMNFPGLDPIEGYEADKTIAGGETLNLAGMDFKVVFTPGHSPGHVTYVVDGEGDQPTAMFSGDVLFQSSVGRTDLPGGDWPTLLESIRNLIDRHPENTVVHPGHMGLTTLGAERETNPFLAELAR